MGPKKNCFRAKTESQVFKKTETGLQMTKWGLKQVQSNRGPKISQVGAHKAMLVVKMDELGAMICKSGPKSQGQKWPSWSPNGKKTNNLSLSK